MRSAPTSSITPQHSCVKPGVQGMRQKNLNIITGSKTQPTCELSCLQALRTVKGFVRQTTSSLWRKCGVSECNGEHSTRRRPWHTGRYCAIQKIAVNEKRQYHGVQIIFGQFEWRNLCFGPYPPFLANQFPFTCYLFFYLANQVRLSYF